MAKRIIVLERESPARWRVCYWLDVPIARQSFYAGQSTMFTGATQAEKDALTSGAVREVVDLYSVEGSPTLPTVQAALQVNWQTLQDATNNHNPWVRYGSYWDGTTWTLGGMS